MRKLTNDVQALQPTLFVAVPRVLERIQSGIEAKVKKLPWLVQTLIGLAHSYKLRAIRSGVPLAQVGTASEGMAKHHRMPLGIETEEPGC